MKVTVLTRGGLVVAADKRDAQTFHSSKPSGDVRLTHKKSA